MTARVEFPRLLGRGSIEARWPECLLYENERFPRLLGRGSIEAVGIRADESLNRCFHVC